MKKGLRIKIKDILYLLLLLYTISISAYQLGTGFDAIFVRITFVIFLMFTFIINRKIIITNQTKWYLLFWILYFLSLLWSKNSSDTMYYFNNCIQIIGISLCLPLIIKDKNDLIRLIKIIVFSLLYTSILLVIKTPSSAWGTIRIGNIIGLNSNDLGMRMAIGSLLSLYLINNELMSKRENMSKSQIVYSAICLLSFIVLSLFTGSKKAIFIIAFGAILYELIVFNQIKNIKKIFITIAIITAIGYSVFNIPQLYNILGRRLESAYLTAIGENSNNKADGSYIERKFYREEAMKLFYDSPIVGVGGNGFVTHLRNITYSHVAYSHCNYTEILATLGLIGFVIYYSFLVNLLIKLYKLYKTNKQNILGLFLIIIFMLLILDYGCVSYISEFITLCYTMAYMVMQFSNNELKCLN